MVPVGEAHECEWKEQTYRLTSELERVQAEQNELQNQLAALQRHIFGKRSEKMPRIDDALRAGEKGRKQETLKLRKRNREKKAAVAERKIHHPVPPEKRHCPKCGSNELRPLGDGKCTVIYEYVPARFEKQIHVQETLSCRCGEGVVVADAPSKPIEKGQYGPGFLAHIVTAKCCDSIPLYRQSKACRRIGIPIARTTMGDLFHSAATSLQPLADRLLELISKQTLVLADETPIRVQATGKTKKSYVWTFRSGKLIAYKYSPTRSGDTAVEVLAGTQGFLVVDGYTGYNKVTVPDGRIRVGCWAHVRRKFFEALPTAQESQGMLDLILELYRIEKQAKDAGVDGTSPHLEIRKTLSLDVVDRIKIWLAQELPRHPPKSPLGGAIRYAQGQWIPLTRFLENSELPLDNNASERALRNVALGRKNFLFVGSDDAGTNTAGLYSLVASCEASDVNPEEYLADVLIRVQSHPQSQIDDLLPHRWSPVVANSS